MAKRRTDHLKPHQFKEGAPSGNPKGRPPLSPEQKALRKLTLHSLQKVIETALTGNVQALKDLATNPDTSALEVGVATAILRAIKDGDPSVLERFAARIVGEIPKNLNINGLVDVQHQVKVIPPEIARQALLEIEEDV